MTEAGQKQRSDYFLTAVCVISVTLNFVLMYFMINPDALREIRLSFKRIPRVTAKDHIRGSGETSTVAIEYSDFLCHFCKELHSTLRKLSDSREVTWVFRNRPLDSIHPLAAKAAVAAECAAQQGKFWEYADLVFDNQERVTSEEVLDDLAEQLSLDKASFSRCKNSNVVALVRDETARAMDLEIDATPTLFINDKRYTGALSLENLSHIIAQKPQ